MVGITREDSVMAGQGKVLVTTEGDVAVACLMDARILDETNVQALHKELEDVVAKKYILKLVLDFKNVTHLSSAVIGKIIALHKQMAKEKGVLKLCGLNTVIRQVFKVTKVDKVIEIHDDVGSAVKSFQKKGWFR
jgi:anti-anti-sigma factor